MKRISIKSYPVKKIADDIEDQYSATDPSDMVHIYLSLSSSTTPSYINSSALFHPSQPIPALSLDV